MAEIADFQVFPQKIKLAGKVPHVDISVKLPVDLSPDAKGVLAFMVRDIEVGSLFAKDAFHITFGSDDFKLLPFLYALLSAPI